MILKWIGKYGDDRILTGDERFDQLFIVRSQNRPAVMKVLTDDVRAKLKDPAFMMPSFTMKPTQFNMTTAFDFTRDKQLSNQLGPQPHRQMFIDTVLAILDQAWS
jgi:TFIIF-interacting CTD phosphatase-like protein